MPVGADEYLRGAEAAASSLLARLRKAIKRENDIVKVTFLQEHEHFAVVEFLEECYLLTSNWSLGGDL